MSATIITRIPASELQSAPEENGYLPVGGYTYSTRDRQGCKNDHPVYVYPDGLIIYSRPLHVYSHGLTKSPTTRRAVALAARLARSLGLVPRVPGLREIPDLY